MSIVTDKTNSGLNQIKENGQQESYLVLSDEEKEKGFIRPVRLSYRHNKCGAMTTMNKSIGETYARDPSFYGGTFCCNCGNHFNLMENGERQFSWEDGSGVGE